VRTIESESPKVSICPVGHLSRQAVDLDHPQRLSYGLRESTVLTMAEVHDADRSREQPDATGRRPKVAGVQQALIRLLIDRGAALDHAAAAGGRSLMNACLANGRPEAAEYLASRGAPLDFESAAGVGRLDVVQSFFSDDGAAKSSVWWRQRHAASPEAHARIARNGTLVPDRTTDEDAPVTPATPC